MTNAPKQRAPILTREKYEISKNTWTFSLPTKFIMPVPERELDIPLCLELVLYRMGFVNEYTICLVKKPAIRKLRVRKKKQQLVTYTYRLVDKEWYLYLYTKSGRKRTFRELVKDYIRILAHTLDMMLLNLKPSVKTLGWYKRMEELKERIYEPAVRYHLQLLRKGERD